MKRIFLIIFLLPITIAISAQIQQGIVKTKGRIDNNGSIIVGSPISDAYVTVLGTQTVASNKDGKFSVGLKSKEFYLKDVTKEGYVLCDADVISRQYAYSAAPLYIVMETPSQLQEDKLYAERQLRRTLTKQLQEKENEIDSLKNRQRISDEEYRQRLQQIFSDQEENEKLITEMSERYAGIDYDQLDEFNRQITKFILNGELMKADSLIRSKGDLSRRHETFKKHQKQLAVEEADLRKKQTHFERNKVSTQKEMEDLAQDYYSLYEIYKMQHKNDSAAYYLELRATLDTTNVEWQLETGNFIMFYLSEYDKSIVLFNTALNMAKREENKRHLSNCMNDLGFAYAQNGQIDQAMSYFQDALKYAYELQDSILESDIQLNIGGIYTDLGDYDKALFSYNTALEKARKDDKSSRAIILGNIGNLYLDMGKIREARKYTEEAIVLIESDANAETNADLASLYGNLSNIYITLEVYDETINYCKKALNILYNIYDELHPLIANVYGTLGTAYFKLGETDKSIEYKEKALEIKKNIYGELSPKISVSYNNLAKLYSDLDLSNKAIELYLKALQIQQINLGENHFSCAIISNNLGFEYQKKNNYEQALIYYFKALQVHQYIKEHGNTNPQIIGVLNNIGCVYQKSGNYRLSIDYFSQCLRYAEQIYDQYPPSFYTTVLSLDTSYRKYLQQKPNDIEIKNQYSVFFNKYKYCIIEKND